jgi:hypothetical protein
VHRSTPDSSRRTTRTAAAAAASSSNFDVILNENCYACVLVSVVVSIVPRTNTHYGQVGAYVLKYALE